jgi:hypothetical protein
MMREQAIDLALEACDDNIDVVVLGFESFC